MSTRRFLCATISFVWARSLRSLVIATAMGSLGVALCQFGSTDADFPGICLGLMPPFDRLCDWLRAGARAPIGDVLERHELYRLEWTGVWMIVLAGMLVWSMRAAGALRPRLRVRTLMILIAAAAVASVAGQKLCDAWDRFDYYCRCKEIGWYSYYTGALDSILGHERPIPSESEGQGSGETSP
jgi:hypothetical protein